MYSQERIDEYPLGTNNAEQGTVNTGAAAAAAAAKSLQSCLTLRPCRWQPTRLLRPWDSPGKNAGVGCHFLLQCMKVNSERKSLSRVRLLATPWTAAYQAPPSRVIQKIMDMIH